jgi:hypothetical protein
VGPLGFEGCPMAMSRPFIYFQHFASQFVTMSRFLLSLVSKSLVSVCFGLFLFALLMQSLWVVKETLCKKAAAGALYV